ncbi:AraC family transcriptional regulator [Zoogloea dura]|uniref:AraC family transcriptional regulator n=1 Tax=Zoogloea dura TaxID=2728840 RepID=A0A848GD45_9RHOO|nr:AraC family transcriptional regulator [Zoogloea dura]NML27401.1 AraC family transcriptional regulator [Zoogloea dura]
MNMLACQDAAPHPFSEALRLGLCVEQALGSSAERLLSEDLDEASSHLSGAYNTHRLHLTGGRSDFRMRFLRTRVGRLGLASLAFGAEVEIEQSGDRPFVLVTTQLRGFSRVRTPGATAEGGPGFIVVDSAGQAVSKHFSHDSERCHVRIEQAVIEARCASLLGQPLGRPLVFAPFCPSQGELPARWMSMLQVLLAYAGHGVGGAGGLGGRAMPEPMLASIEETILLHLLFEHEHNYSAALRRPARTLAPRHVRRAEEYIRSHAAEPLNLSLIAAAAGCCVRSLSEGFRAARGGTPMNFLRQVRLEGVRRDLDGGLPPGGISELALRWGFSHFGRFAADYRRHFGELPSETARRAALR